MNDTETKQFDIPPNSERVFRSMIQEALIQSQDVFEYLPRPDEAQALRAALSFLTPLNFAAQSITNAENVERFRDVVATITASFSKRADEIEAEMAEANQ
jgi:hypothetical protein